MKTFNRVLQMICVLFFVNISSTYAAMVVHEEIGVVNDKEFSRSSFRISNEGWYYASIRDMHFTDNLEAVGLSVKGSDNDKKSGFGEAFTFYALPGIYYLDVMALAGNTFGLGMYGVQIELLPPTVPLPPAFYLLLSAMLGLVYFSRKNKPPHNKSEAHFV